MDEINSNLLVEIVMLYCSLREIFLMFALNKYWRNRSMEELNIHIDEEEFNTSGLREELYNAKYYDHNMINIIIRLIQLNRKYKLSILVFKGKICDLHIYDDEFAEFKAEFNNKKCCGQKPNYPLAHIGNSNFELFANLPKRNAQFKIVEPLAKPKETILTKAPVVKLIKQPITHIDYGVLLINKLAKDLAEQRKKNKYLTSGRS